jgi:hypothetical protein
MKFAIAVLTFLWLMMGAFGAWWMDDLDAEHWKEIIKGPITLAEAYNENPPNYPGPN